MNTLPDVNRRLASAVGVALTLVFLAGCGSDGGTSPDKPSTPSAAANPLEGTWRTEPVSVSDANATLRKHGLEKWIKKFKSESPIQSPTVLVLEVTDEWDLYMEPEGSPREEVDYDAEYKFRGNEVEVIHSDGPTLYEWAVDGDTLTFEWQSTTLPGYNGIPDEVFQRVLYMSSPFTKDQS